ncbi:hypothetical protein BJP36_36820 [Moorena producens JHB]|uniref:Uncharacterized protein n=1 Tax=Moorena producens (strain JHB) TaxID=1454205 RepID=A0A9Q9SU14_MOOP1|nr:hypothetical protein [Moorena producens]WAN69659.1 hypothetical protein BJP36_36820 [Moorena producens JHB]
MTQLSMLMNWMTIFIITNQLKDLARGFQEEEIVTLAVRQNKPHNEHAQHECGQKLPQE